MASISYFSQLPNFNYPNPIATGGKKEQYVEVKNLFLRMKVADKAYNNITAFAHYAILEGERPDTVAEKLYGSPNYDWVVLLTANITNVRDEWPISSRVLYEYAEEKYGTALNDTRHYETKEVRDSRGRLLMPGGQVVDQDFTIPNPENPGTVINPTVAVSNWLVEVRKNNEKRAIRYLKKEYIQTLLENTRDFLQYQDSSQYTPTKGKTGYYSRSSN